MLLLAGLVSGCGGGDSGTSPAESNRARSDKPKVIDQGVLPVSLRRATPTLTALEWRRDGAVARAVARKTQRKVEDAWCATRRPLRWLGVCVLVFQDQRGVPLIPSFGLGRGEVWRVERRGGRVVHVEFAP